MNVQTLPPLTRAQGCLTLPGSKSLSNRYLLLAALAEGNTELHNLLESEDTNHMLRALQDLDVKVSKRGSVHSVEGRGGPLATTGMTAELFLGNAGTAMRPLCAALPLGQGQFVLHGEARMYERPIGALVEGLRGLGAQIEYLQEEGFPPLQISASGLTGGAIHIDGNLSSQFLSALLMAAPLAQDEVHITVTGDQVSKPYIDLTVRLIERFGAELSRQGYCQFTIAGNQGFKSPGAVLVEGDASSATYFLAAGALAGDVKVRGIARDSLQGDVRFVELLARMGAQIEYGDDFIRCRQGSLVGIDEDCNDIPDAAMTLAILALFAQGPTRLRNIYNWRIKETDRLSAMTTELKKVGAHVTEGEDSIEIQPLNSSRNSFRPARIATYNDHRIAMCFSLCAFGGSEVTIENPACTAKTFPHFFQEFLRICS